MGCFVSFFSCVELIIFFSAHNSMKKIKIPSLGSATESKVRSQPTSNGQRHGCACCPTDWLIFAHLTTWEERRATLVTGPVLKFYRLCNCQDRVISGCATLVFRKHAYHLQGSSQLALHSWNPEGTIGRCPGSVKRTSLLHGNNSSSRKPSQEFARVRPCLLAGTSLSDDGYHG